MTWILSIIRKQYWFWYVILSGRVIEFELEGVTLTSAHNFSSGARILSQINRQSEDIQRGRPLEAMISRYRVLGPRQAQIKAQSQTNISLQPHGDARSLSSSYKNPFLFLLPLLVYRARNTFWIQEEKAYISCVDLK